MRECIVYLDVNGNNDANSNSHMVMKPNTVPYTSLHNKVSVGVGLLVELFVAGV